MASHTILELKEKINSFPKKDLIPLPTPLRKLKNLSQDLEGPEIFIKRDDLTGLAFGGNKSRKLEFIIQDVLDKKADVVITWASVQSNWCLQTSAAARKFGIEPIMLLFKTYELTEEYDGNLLLDYILDADIRIKEIEDRKIMRVKDIQEIIEEVINEVKEKGHTPYVAPIGGSMVDGSMEKPLGAISYVNAFAEMLEQMGEDSEVNYVIHASGSGGTQAGLAAGAKASKDNAKVLGISVSDEKEPYRDEVFNIAQDTVKALGLDFSMEREDIIVFDEYIKEGYGVVNREVSDAIRLLAVREGIFLDPVYTGKAMTALIDLVKKGYFKKEDKIVYFHTGGTAALFPNKYRLVDFLKP
ncbi:MAG: D-cysteine desulfhydrase family protein [Candidatus Aminicenantes bacterium]|nr:MAG: D-cysteine desulfhydrase family protein [Candidatus Aminicenantes bacterium]